MRSERRFRRLTQDAMPNAEGYGIKENERADTPNTVHKQQLADELPDLRRKNMEI
jgi:hypothetical protein